ncbi:MAG TPA: cell division protein FtsA [Candidatus Goldiibacteriota bacterium]|nr:cell division protein FtsA [Candidatus Goldiibacteriota bacterium]HPN63968.1 cell division protein FtsA [Candidatus Goldiibacteriota bacterium]HRQ43114.1 cell division protein FtsA [Candidatus Goldiibacteriota bacterium]
MGSANDGHIVAAVDIGTTKVCTVIAEIKENEINVIGTGWEENKGVSKGNVVNIADTSEAIRKSLQKAEQMASVKVNSVVASVSGKNIAGIKGHGMTSLSHSKQKEITEIDKDRAIEGATSVPMSHDMEVLHVIPTQYIVDSQDEIKNPIGMTGLKLEVDAYIITGSVTAIDNVKKVISKAGYSTEDIVLQSIASSEAVLYPDEKDIGVLLVDIGGGTTDLALYQKDALKFVKVIPVGGNLITSDLVTLLQTTKTNAEEIKKKYGIVFPEDAAEDEMIDVPDMGSNKVTQVSRRQLAVYIQARVRELVEFVRIELEKEGIDKGMYSGGVVVTGGTAQLNGIEKMLREQMNVRARVGVPIKEKIVGLYDIVSQPEYSTAVGLVGYFVNESGLNNHFLQKKSGDSIWQIIKNLISEYI